VFWKRRHLVESSPQGHLITVAAEAVEVELSQVLYDYFAAEPQVEIPEELGRYVASQAVIEAHL